MQEWWALLAKDEPIIPVFRCWRERVNEKLDSSHGTSLWIDAFVSGLPGHRQVDDEDVVRRLCWESVSKDQQIAHVRPARLFFADAMSLPCLVDLHRLFWLVSTLLFQCIYSLYSLYSSEFYLLMQGFGYVCNEGYRKMEATCSSHIETRSEPIVKRSSRI